MSSPVSSTVGDYVRTLDVARIQPFVFAVNFFFAHHVSYVMIEFIVNETKKPPLLLLFDWLGQGTFPSNTNLFTHDVFLPFLDFSRAGC